MRIKSNANQGSFEDWKALNARMSNMRARLMNVRECGNKDANGEIIEEYLVQCENEISSGKSED